MIETTQPGQYSHSLLRRRQGQTRARSRFLDASVTEFLLSIILGLVSFLDIFSKLKLGSISFNGLLTVTYALIVVLLLLLRSDISRQLILTTLPGLLLAAWSVTSIGWAVKPSIQAIQNIAVMITFMGSIVLVGALRASSRAHRIVLIRRLPVALVLGTIIFAASKTRLYTSQGRFYALFAAVGAMWFASGWRFKERGARFFTLALVFSIGLSLSRTALASCVLLLPWIVAFRPKAIMGWLRPFFTLVILGGITIIVIFTVPALNDRFTGTGDRGVSVGGTSVSTSGRAEIWRTVYVDALRSPVKGLGAGSAVDLVTKQYGPIVTQPHNDFLRIFHDFGLIGLVLWFLLLVSVFKALRRAYKTATYNRDISQQRATIAATTAVIIMLLSMVTDNIIVYPAPMFVVAILIGNALGGYKPLQRQHRGQRFHEMYSSIQPIIESEGKRTIRCEESGQ